MLLWKFGFVILIEFECWGCEILFYVVLLLLFVLLGYWLWWCGWCWVVLFEDLVFEFVEEEVVYFLC